MWSPLTGWGKTRLGSLLTIACALQGKRAWWVAPTYKMAAVGWRGIRQLAEQIPGVEISKVSLQATMPTGGWVQVRSADDPHSLRGEGLDYLVMDECAFTKEAAWREALRPALSDREGKALFISTPKGRNWFWYLWQRGQQGATGWAAWQFPTIANPFINPAEVENAEHDLPERIFHQEYLAEFIDDAGGIFRKVMAAVTAERQSQAAVGHEYVIGVDWAKHNDFSVFSVMCAATRELVCLDRFNKIDYMLQIGRLKVLYEHFKPYTIIAESNAMGEPLIEQLQRDGLPVVPFTTTHASKTQAIDALTLAFEKGEIHILNDPTLIGELQAYEMRRLPSGALRYSAPEGMHDDTVISLALAWFALNQPRYPPPGVVRYA